MLISLCAFVIFVTNYEIVEIGSSKSFRDLSMLVSNPEVVISSETLRGIAIEAMKYSKSSDELKTKIIRFSGWVWAGTLVFIAYIFWLIGTRWERKVNRTSQTNGVGRANPTENEAGTA